MFEPAVPDCLIISIFLACKGISRQIAGIKEPAVWFLRCLESQKGFDRHKIPVVVKQKHMISQGSDPTVHRFSDGNLFSAKLTIDLSGSHIIIICCEKINHISYHFSGCVELRIVSNPQTG